MALWSWRGGRSGLCSAREGYPCPGLTPHTHQDSPAAKISTSRPQSALARILRPLANSGKAAGQSLAPAPGISGLVELRQEETTEPAAPPTATPGARRQPPPAALPCPLPSPGHPVPSRCPARPAHGCHPHLLSPHHLLDLERNLNLAFDTF